MIYWRKYLLHIKLWLPTCLLSSNPVSYRTLIQFQYFFLENKLNAQDHGTWEHTSGIGLYICCFFTWLPPAGHAPHICSDPTVHWSLTWWHIIAATSLYHVWQSVHMEVTIHGSGTGWGDMHLPKSASYEPSSQGLLVVHHWYSCLSHFLQSCPHS